MKKLILSELLLLFLATTFVTDSPPPGWYQQSVNIGNRLITDIFFLDSLTGWVVTNGGTSGTDSALCLKTTDGGNNWTEQIRIYGLFNAIQFIDINTGYIAADRGPGFMLKSTNSGVNWFQVFNAGDGLTDLCFVNKDTGWAADPGGAFGVGIIKTTNGGTNWFQQMSGNNFPQKLFFINSDTGWTISNEANSKLYRTTDGGQVWAQQYSFLTATADIFFINRDTGFVSGNFVPNSIRITTNGGFNWDSTSNSQGGRDIYFVNNLIGYNCANFSIVQKTTNGGYSWFRQTVPSGFYGSIYFPDTLKGWSGGTILISTTDGGGPPAGIIQVSSKTPSDFKLYQNYPNPFNPGTIIRFQIKRSADLKLSVYDLTGKEIAVLANGEYKPGTYEVDFSGEGLSSGVYFYKIIITAGKEVYSDTKRMVLVK